MLTRCVLAVVAAVVALTTAGVAQASFTQEPGSPFCSERQTASIP